jgi:hypothetical protein
MDLNTTKEKFSAEIARLITKGYDETVARCAVIQMALDIENDDLDLIDRAQINPEIRKEIAALAQYYGGQIKEIDDGNPLDELVELAFVAITDYLYDPYNYGVDGEAWVSLTLQFAETWDENCW